ncbi:MAG TPA: ABC transporter ATP-binding protein [Polyangiaceae bacterium]|nr:ABC transporter ATP-binding protein [Polyangiaceae bacterium]
MSAPRAESKPAESFGLVGRLLRLSLAYRRECFEVFALQVVLLGLGVFGLGLSGVAIDVIRAALEPQAPAPRWPLGLAPHAALRPNELLFAIGAAVLAMALLRAALSYSYQVLIGRLVHLKIVPALRTQVFEKLQRLSFRFFDENATGSIINRVTGDVQSLRSFVDGVLLQGVIMLISLTLYLVYMLRTNVVLTLACLGLAPVLWLVTTRFSRRIRPAYAESRTLSDRLILALTEGIHGMLVIKVFGREADELARFRERNLALRNQQRDIFRRVSRYSPTINFLSQLNVAMLLTYGGHLVARGALSLGELIVFAGLLQQFSAQVSSMSVVVNTLQQSLAGARRVFEVLDAPLEVANTAHPVAVPRLRGAIRFERVSFRYANGDEALSELDFAIEPGECVAILGATGSGKSTLLGLIPRFFDATAGRVLVDGIDVRVLELDGLRRNVGLVFQESLLFRTTVAENIAFGDAAASRERVERAARVAGAHGFVNALPNGYDHVLEESGANLSGGQRQRLAIARAVLTDPPILLLDDPTTAVDAKTESEVLEAIDGARAGRTTVIVANRMATLRRADRILVLHDGRLVEQGSHEALMLRRGAYFRAAALQAPDAESMKLLVAPGESA